MFLRKFLLLLGLVALIGCDRGPVNAPPEDVDQPDFEMRLLLQDATDTGLLPEGLNVEEYVYPIREADPAKADEIAAELEELKGMSDSEKIKAKAQEILSKL
jgi:predicted small lipoprotein YifL